MPNNTLMPASEIDLASLIHIIRGTQVMLDSDLAALYQVETKRLNEAVKRNKERFPKQFMFQLSDDEYTHLRSQIATSSVASQYGGRRYNPFVFTEQGIAMLSAVLRSKIAIDVSIRIMDAFVKMRRFLINNQAFLSRLDQVELKQLETDRKLEQVFHHIASQTEVKQNIFFQGQIYDTFSFLIDLIQKAKKSIYLIDNYVDTHTLNILSKKNKDVEVTIFTAGKGRLSKQDIHTFNLQYPVLSVNKNTSFHDRFVILDEKEAYHIGASIKDAGKKCFGITKMEDKSLIESLIKQING